MLTTLLGWIVKSKAVKVGAGALGGSGALALIFGLHYDIKQEVGIQKKDQKEYVHLVLEPLKVEIKNLNKDIVETKLMVRDLHKHMLRNK